MNNLTAVGEVKLVLKTAFLIHYIQHAKLLLADKAQGGLTCSDSESIAKQPRWDSRKHLGGCSAFSVLTRNVLTAAYSCRAGHCGSAD